MKSAKVILLGACIVGLATLAVWAYLRDHTPASGGPPDVTEDHGREDKGQPALKGRGAPQAPPSAGGTQPDTGPEPGESTLTVVDEGGSAVASAVLTVVRPDHGVQAQGLSDSEGVCKLHVPTGMYYVRVEAPDGRLSVSAVALPQQKTLVVAAVASLVVKMPHWGEDMHGLRLHANLRGRAMRRDVKAGPHVDLGRWPSGFVRIELRSGAEVVVAKTVAMPATGVVVATLPLPTTRQRVVLAHSPMGPPIRAWTYRDANLAVPTSKARELMPNGGVLELPAGGAFPFSAVIPTSTEFAASYFQASLLRPVERDGAETFVVVPDVGCKLRAATRELSGVQLSVYFIKYLAPDVAITGVRSLVRRRSEQLVGVPDFHPLQEVPWTPERAGGYTTLRVPSRAVIAIVARRDGGYIFRRMKTGPAGSQLDLDLSFTRAASINVTFGEDLALKRPIRVSLHLRSEPPRTPVAAMLSDAERPRMVFEGVTSRDVAGANQLVVEASDGETLLRRHLAFRDGENEAVEFSPADVVRGSPVAVRVVHADQTPAGGALVTFSYAEIGVTTKAADERGIVHHEVVGALTGISAWVSPSEAAFTPYTPGATEVTVTLVARGTVRLAVPAAIGDQARRVEITDGTRVVAAIRFDQLAGDSVLLDPVPVGKYVVVVRNAANDVLATRPCVIEAGRETLVRF